MKNGDIVFFTEAKPSAKRTAPIAKFRGHGFGILLGYVQHFQKDPPPLLIHRLVGTIGFLSFDDVSEFLGDEMAALCVKKFEEKYYQGMPQTEEDMIEPVAVPKILDSSGSPLTDAIRGLMPDSPDA